MPGWAKALIIIGICIFLFIIVAIGAGIYLWKQHGQEFIEAGQRSVIEGREFGSKTDQQACVAESVSRYKRSPGLGSAISTKLFLNGCLAASRSTAGFCDNVPQRSEFVKSAQW